MSSIVDSEYELLCSFLDVDDDDNAEILAKIIVNRVLHGF